MSSNPCNYRGGDH